MLSVLQTGAEAPERRPPKRSPACRQVRAGRVRAGRVWEPGGCCRPAPDAGRRGVSFGGAYRSEAGIPPIDLPVVSVEEIDASKRSIDDRLLGAGEDLRPFRGAIDLDGEDGSGEKAGSSTDRQAGEADTPFRQPSSLMPSSWLLPVFGRRPGCIRKAGEPPPIGPPVVCGAIHSRYVSFTVPPAVDGKERRGFRLLPLRIPSHVPLFPNFPVAKRQNIWGTGVLYSPPYWYSKSPVCRGVWEHCPKKSHLTSRFPNARRHSGPSIRVFPKLALPCLF